MRDWTTRLVAGLCARAGCPRQPLPDHALCLFCAEDHNERQRESKRRREAARLFQMKFNWRNA